jgi:hypothetical protein
MSGCFSDRRITAPEGVWVRKVEEQMVDGDEFDESAEALARDEWENFRCEGR